MAGTSRVLLFSWLVLVGCQPSDAEKSFDLIFQAMDAEVADRVATELEKSDITYLREDDKTIRYSSSDYASFTQISRLVILDDLPSDRSVAFYIPELNAILLQEFEKEGIRYEQKYRNNTQWVVWSETDHGKAKQIVDRLKQRGSREDWGQSKNSPPNH